MTSSAADSSSVKYKYFAGTLKYTTRSLFLVFFWMLLGGFFFTLMDRLFPVLMPLALKEFDASNRAIGLVVGSIPSVLNMIICPVVSFRSDRTRSRWGRRMPYLIGATPLVTLFLVLIGWAPMLGDAVAGILGHGIAGKTCGYVLLVAFSIFYQIFYMFVASVYYYLFADVIPEKFMGRFVAGLGLVGNAAYYVFQSWLLGYADKYMPWVYTGIAVLYGIFFLMMCLMVREGEYPPVTDVARSGSWLSSVKVYFTECFSNPFYLFFFLGTALNSVSMVCGNLFNVFFAEKNLGLSLDEFGKINGLVSLISIVLVYPLGLLVDKFHLLRVYICAVLLVVLANVFGYFFTVDKNTYIVTTILLGVVYALQSASYLPLFTALLPRERYGQFCSAQAIFNSILLIIANWGGGLFIDLTGDYRNVYSWDAFFTFAALLAMLMVWRGWKRYGGAAGYQAP